MTGAAVLAGMGALRGGAGLVRIAIPATLMPIVAGHRPEFMTTSLPESPQGGLGSASLGTLRTELASFDVGLLGPGSGRASSTSRVLRRLVLDAEQPLVVDADALFALGTDLEAMQSRAAPTILTPHEGEAARLLGWTSDVVRADREAAARTLAERTGAIVVLKGPSTIVTQGEHRFVCATGGPVLAVGGSGDVLAGTTAALWAAAVHAAPDQDAKARAFDVACTAAFAHGAAGDGLAAQADRGWLASEIADAIPAALQNLSKDAEAPA